MYLYKFEASKEGVAQMRAYSFYTYGTKYVPNCQWNMLLMCSG